MIPLLKDLALETLRDPASAARRILSMGLSSQAIWTGVALVAVVNTLLYSLSILQFEGMTGAQTGMNLPILYLALLSAAMVIGALVLQWIGKMMGGTAEFLDLLVLLAWLQGLRAVAQAALIALMMVSTSLANLAALALGLYGLWLMAQFVNTAQGWDSLGKAIMSLVLAGVGFVLALSIFVLLIGASSMGM